MKTGNERHSLKGKVAVVIGGAGYLCSTLTEAMMKAGMEVAVLDLAEAPAVSASVDGKRRRRKARAVGSGSSGLVSGPETDRPGCRTTQQATLSLGCDVTSKEDLLQSRETILKAYGRVDVLLNGAGTNAPTPFLEISEEEIQRIIGVNLIGTLHGCQVFGEVMVKQRAGSIVNFTSVSAGPPLSKAFVYSTAKAGVANLTQNLAREWAPFNVRVNALRPGFFPTQWSMDHFIDEDRKANILGHTPMGRFGTPDELVGAVLWLASDAASFVTGSIVTVDGGFSAMSI